MKSFSYLFPLRVFWLIAALYAFHGRAEENTERPIVVVVPSYNNAGGEFYRRTLDSIVAQDYHNFRIIYVVDDDYAYDSDGTGFLVERYRYEHGLQDRMIIIRNRSRQLGLQNLYKAVLSTRDEEIIAVLDGDGDEFAHSGVLTYVNAMYSSKPHPVWLTYGNYKWLSSQEVWTYTWPIPYRVLRDNSIRSWGSGATSLKTFKSWLFKQIKIRDLFYDGGFFSMSKDVAVYIPMLEMANYRYAYTTRVLYVYNDLNTINDFKVDGNLQKKLGDFVRDEKTSYEPLKESAENVLEEQLKNSVLRPVCIVFGNGDAAMLTQVNFEEGPAFLVSYNERDKWMVTSFGNESENVFSKGSLGELLYNLISSLSDDYIVFANGPLIPNNDLLERAAYWLELTHAHRFYGNATLDKFQEYSETSPEMRAPSIISIDEPPVDTSVYAWQYQDTKDKSLVGLEMMPILRKAEVLSLLSTSTIKDERAFETLLMESCSHDDIGLFFCEGTLERRLPVE